MVSLSLSLVISLYLCRTLFLFFNLSTIPPPSPSLRGSLTPLLSSHCHWLRGFAGKHTICLLKNPKDDTATLSTTQQGSWASSACHPAKLPPPPFRLNANRLTDIIHFPNEPPYRWVHGVAWATNRLPGVFCMVSHWECVDQRAQRAFGGRKQPCCLHRWRVIQMRQLSGWFTWISRSFFILFSFFFYISCSYFLIYISKLVLRG